MKKLFLIFFCFSSLNLIAQSEVIKTRDSITIGFYCGVSGIKSSFVKDFERKILNTSNFNNLKNDLKLKSIKDGSNVFLTIIIFRELEKQNLISSSEEDKLKIDKLSQMSIPIFICEGCFSETFFLNNLLSNKEKSSFAKHAKEWAKELIEKAKNK